MYRKNNFHLLIALAACFILSLACSKNAQLLTTSIDTRYEVREGFREVINKTIADQKKQVAAARQAGKLIAYISTPVTSKGGGVFDLNIEIASSVKERLEKKFGAQRFWALDPGAIDMPKVNGKSANGQEYMYMYTQLLAGEDGTAKDFDMVYFVGIEDAHAYLKVKPEKNILGQVEQFLARRARTESKLAEIYNDEKKRLDFIRYYGLKFNASVSKGALDEWNLFYHVNKRRPVPNQVIFYLNGRMVSPGSKGNLVRKGYEQ